MDRDAVEAGRTDHHGEPRRALTVVDGRAGKVHVRSDRRVLALDEGAVLDGDMAREEPMTAELQPIVAGLREDDRPLRRGDLIAQPVVRS